VGRLAVLASGNGSNFQALVEGLRAGGRHDVALLLCDRPGVFALERAERLGVPARVVRYAGRPRAEAEAEMDRALRDVGADLVALAGFMRLLGPGFVAGWRGRLVNIHPALLPAYPGSDAIRRAWEAGERVSGVTVHWVDEGMDTGAVIERAEVPFAPGSSLEDVEAAVHRAEHALYVRIVAWLLDAGIQAAGAST